ncbi:hypothetical protein [Phenylobacterium sp. J367]|uniref:hypothetical protein n=1 Tax=Phenylobacterium sp. J367 TaxID=2898435 RepID=UPI002150E97B|nr:hypothetical protein [Phenylobacterium sp. J367]MCR5878105.1 hypothetical protein [Phenylobacterium sp. J367]
MEDGTPGTGADQVIQFIPMMTLGLIYAVIVFVIARKRGVNPWPWTIATLVPAIGLIVAGVFYLLSFLSVLDRLNALEGKTPSA